MKTPTVLSLALLALAGCNGDKDADTDTDVLAFVVLDLSSPAFDPVEGVTVAFDTTDGDRIEVVSDADGIAAVTLDAERFAGAIGHADGRSFTAYTRDGALDGLAAGYAQTMWSWPLSPSATRAATASSWPVSGAVLNRSDPASGVYITTTAGGEFLDYGAPSYELAIPGGQDFTLVALEFADDPNWDADRIIDETVFGWSVLAQPAISGPTTLDIDFADPTAPQTLSGSVVAPSDPILAGQGTMYFWISAGAATVGYSPSTAPGTDGASYDFSAEYVDVSGYTPATFLQIWAPDGSRSYASFDGLPSDGAQDLGLLSPTRRSAPTGDGPFAWDEEVAWGAPFEGQLAKYYADEGQIGLVYVGPDETSYTLPPLPSTSTTLSTGGIIGQLSTCVSTDADPSCERGTEDASFGVLSPL